MAEDSSKLELKNIKELVDSFLINSVSEETRALIVKLVASLEI